MSARAKENPKLKRELTIAHKWFLHHLNKLGYKKAAELERKDYLKWRNSKEAVKKYGPRRK